MKELIFQQKAVRKLVEMTIDLLGLTVLQMINPKVEIRISATPKTNSDHKISCNHQMLGAGEGDGCHGGVAISNVDLGNDGLWGVLDLTEGVAHLRMLQG